MRWPHIVASSESFHDTHATHRAVVQATVQLLVPRFQPALYDLLQDMHSMTRVQKRALLRITQPLLMRFYWFPSRWEYSRRATSHLAVRVSLGP